MDTEKKLKVLKKIARRLNGAGVTWALGASLLLYLKGITDHFHDIDLMAEEEDAAAAKEILLSMGELQPPNPNGKYKTKEFLEYIVDGVDVDLMIGFAIVEGGRVHDCSLRREQISEFYSLEGERIPMQSLRLWNSYYQWMGRSDKCRMIREYLGVPVNGGPSRLNSYELLQI